jgi:hypothetical protein
MISIGLVCSGGFAQTKDTKSPTPEPQLPNQTNDQQPPAAPKPQLPAPSPQLPFGGVKHQLDREQHSEVTLDKIPRNILRDGAHIGVGPLYFRTGDLRWLLPLATASAVAFETDTHTMTQVVSRNPGPAPEPTSFNNTNITVSDWMRDGFIATPVVMAGIGMAGHKERLRETGLLGSEAMVDAYVIDELVKIGTFRERPLVDNGRGEFYIGSAGINSSFVSGHSMIAWASAAVIAGECHSRWLQTGVYTAATGVSLARVLGQQHFPTDVLIGAAGGWLIGHYVFRAHHHHPQLPDYH